MITSHLVPDPVPAHPTAPVLCGSALPMFPAPVALPPAVWFRPGGSPPRVVPAPGGSRSRSQWLRTHCGSIFIDPAPSPVGPGPCPSGSRYRWFSLSVAPPLSSFRSRFTAKVSGSPPPSLPPHLLAARPAQNWVR